VAPRALIVAGVVDAAGHPVPRASVPYPDFRDQPAWDFDTLSKL
jgi:hypothetical protein